MLVVPHITFRGMDTSEALEQKIRARIADLEQIYNRITACSVRVESFHKHSSGGRSFQVSVDLTLPKGDIVVRREPAPKHGHEDAYVAVREAFDVARRQLEDRIRIHRGDVKTHASTSGG